MSSSRWLRWSASNPRARTTSPASMASSSWVCSPKEQSRGGTRLKIGDHIFTRRDKGSDDRLAPAQDVAPVLEAARAIFARFDEYKILERKVCYYTVTENEGFVVEAIGLAGWVLSACSGHGFKLGPLIASGLAGVLTGSRSSEGFSKWAAGHADIAPSIL